MELQKFRPENLDLGLRISVMVYNFTCFAVVGGSGLVEPEMGRFLVLGLNLLAQQRGVLGLEQI